MPHVLLVMRKRGNLKVLGEVLRGQGYAVTSVTSPAEIDALLRRSDPADAALVDITGYRAEIWTLCEALQRARVPFLVISEPKGRPSGGRGLELGAASVLEKPLVKDSLLKLLEGLTR